MTNEKDKNEGSSGGTLKMAQPKRLQLTKTVGGGQIQQNISRGRSKTVMVEVRRTRTFSQDATGEMVEERNKALRQNAAAFDADALENSNLTEDEKVSRLRALKEAEAARVRQLEEEERLKNDPEYQAKLKAEAEEAAKSAQEAEELNRQGAAKKEPKDDKYHKKHDDAKTPKSLADVEAAAAAEEENKKRHGHVHIPRVADKLALPEGAGDARPGHGKPKGDDRRSGKLTISNAFDENTRQRSMASIKRAREKAKRKEMDEFSVPTEKFVREVTIPETIQVQELANRMAVRGIDVVKELMKLGMMANLSHVIDADTAELIVNEFGHKSKRVTEGDVENILKTEDAPEALSKRAPVVTIMGHVDHGKTTLLDSLRATDVAMGEAGGITQHIGAYQVKLESGQLVTFLDTPGHQAFSAMRARGAKVTDIVVLVVAADDGVMPQTEEAIAHAKAAGVPIIVAINKMDKPDANPRRVKDELLRYELVPEELGGETLMVEISAQKKTNLDKLLDAILLQAEMLDLKANPNTQASGVVVEARVDRGKGVVATLLVQRGTLKGGDIVVAGVGNGRVRALLNDKGQAIQAAGPSLPVEVLGLSELPDAGDEFSVVENEKQSREIIEYRLKRQRDRKAADNIITMDQLFHNASSSAAKGFAVVVKGDVQGSVEAIVGSLGKISSDEVSIKAVHAAAGGITESDVNLASTSNAIILGFNVRANAQAKELADRLGVDIRYYSIIYNLIDDVKQLVSGILEPLVHERYIGRAEIQQVFKTSKSGKVAGCLVKDGMIKRNAGCRIIRDDVVVHTGKLKTLKRFKDDASEVKAGLECGIAFESYEDMREGDVIEAFEFVEEKRTL